MPAPLPDEILRMAAPLNGIASFERTIHILEDRFIFFNNPKVACSTLKFNLNALAIKSELNIDFDYEPGFAIHDRGQNFLAEPSQVGMNKFLEMLHDPKIFKFCFVREPVSRLISAYGNKIYGLKPYGRTIIKRLGLRQDHEMSFNLFVEILQVKEILYSDPHWRPQVDQLCYDHVDFSFIGDFDRFNQHFDKIVSKLFLHLPNTSFVQSPQFIDARLVYPASSSERKIKNSLKKNITTEMRKKIEKIYARDVELYRQVCSN